MKNLTIFTPTYNRLNTLPRLYNSLINQTDKNFVWLVVDDGSEDGTKQLIKKWQSENKLEIKYIYQENHGKSYAHNVGVNNCQTELFLDLDSDDYLTLDCVEEINKMWAKERNLHTNLAGIIFLKGKDSVEPLSGLELPSIQYSTHCGVYKKGFRGDLGIVFKTKILRDYPFPIIDGEKFITENYVYCQIDQHYKYALYNKILMICEYLATGYSANQIKVFFSNAKGYALYYNLKVKLEKDFFNKIKYSIMYVTSCLASKQAGLKKANNKFLYVCTYILGLVYYFYKKRKQQKMGGGHA